MTNTRAIAAAAGVIHACMQQGKTIPTSIAYALDSACLLNSPETAAELVALRKASASTSALPWAELMHKDDRHDFLSDLVAAAIGYYQGDPDEAVFAAVKRVCETYRLIALAQDGQDHAPGELPEALIASSGAVIETATEPSVDPNGCSRCGIPKDKHGRQWTLSAGWHPWNPPTDEQIKDRMLRRRSVNELRALLARQTEDPHDSELHHTYAVPRDFPEPGVRS